jgi:hypothetical protein
VRLKDIRQPGTDGSCLATCEAEIRRIMVQTICLGPISKITRTKRTGGMPQIAEWLLCNCKALSSNSSLTPKNKLKKEAKKKLFV